jgi:hypothetical protein
MRAWWMVAVLAGVSCQRPPPPAPTPAPPPPSVVVPEGCLANLSGAWEHATDPTYRYLATDDGGTLGLTVTRVEPPDARFHPRKFRDAGVPFAAATKGRSGGRDAGATPDAGRAPDAGATPDAGRAPDGGADAGATLEPELVDGGAPGPAVHLVLTRTAQGFVGQTRLTVQHPSGRDCEAVFPAEVVDCRDGGLVISATPSVSLGDGCQPPEAEASGAPVRHVLRRPASP